jgi:hypothetical protein
MIALEAIVALRNLLNQSPENPDQLFCSYEPARNVFPAVFLTSRVPSQRKHPEEIRRDHLTPSNRRRDLSRCFVA